MASAEFVKVLRRRTRTRKCQKVLNFPVLRRRTRTRKLTNLKGPPLREGPNEDDAKEHIATQKKVVFY